MNLKEELVVESFSRALRCKWIEKSQWINWAKGQYEQGINTSIEKSGVNMTDDYKVGL